MALSVTLLMTNCLQICLSLSFSCFFSLQVKFSASEMYVSCSSVWRAGRDGDGGEEGCDFALLKGLQSTRLSHTDKLQRLLSSYSVLDSVPGSSSIPHLSSSDSEGDLSFPIYR